jgi:molecular chaperone GrpE
MSNEKKTDTTAENGQATQAADPFAQDEAAAKAEGAAASGVKQPETGEAKPQDAGAEDDSASEERITELEERLKRAIAEQENLRKRMEREKADTARYAIANFAREVLGIADNIQRAIDAVPKDAASHDPALKSFLEGIEVTERELHKSMERHGIAKLNPEGEKFDPNYHQAMFEIPTSDMPSGMVMQVVQPGYVLEDRVLRPALVGVSKAAPAAPNNDDPVKEAPHDGGNDPAPERPADEAQSGDGAAALSGQQPESNASSQGASAQPRGSSRLNEPVINAETQDDYEAASASRKA